MKKKFLYALGFLAVVLTLSTISPVFATDWGSPLATDVLGDGENPGEDLQSVDAHYFNEFAFFRFKLNENIYEGNIYRVYVDFDKNTSSGDTSTTESDIGYEFAISCDILQVPAYIKTSIYLDITGGSTYSVDYNISAGNIPIAWSPDPNIVPNFNMTYLMNSSQGEVVYGVNWTWITEQMALLGVEGDNYTMYLEFESGAASDWCPNRTAGETDYIEWDIRSDSGPNGGIPGFPMAFALLSTLTFLGITLLMRRNRLKF